MHAFTVLTEKHLHPNGYNDTTFTVAVNCANPKTEIQIEIIEIQKTGIQIYFVTKKILFLSDKLVCLLLNKKNKIKVNLRFSTIVEDN